MNAVEIPAFDKIEIYPNPGNSKFSIKYSGNLKITSWQLYCMTAIAF